MHSQHVATLIAALIFFGAPLFLSFYVFIHAMREVDRRRERRRVLNKDDQEYRRSAEGCFKMMGLL